MNRLQTSGYRLQGGNRLQDRGFSALYADASTLP